MRLSQPMSQERNMGHPAAKTHSSKPRRNAPALPENLRLRQSIHDNESKKRTTVRRLREVSYVTGRSIPRSAEVVVLVFSWSRVSMPVGITDFDRVVSSDIYVAAQDRS